MGGLPVGEDSAAEPRAGGTETEQAGKRAADFLPPPEYARKKRHIVEG